MTREELIDILKEHGWSACDEAADMLGRDIKVIMTLAEHLDCMIDYVCESGARRMVGAVDAVRDARNAIDKARTT